MIYISDLVLVSHLASDPAKAGKEGFDIFFVVVEGEGSSGRGHDAKELVQRLCAVMASSDCDVLGIDEAQFFDDQIVPVCNELAERGIRVIIAGLDLDFKGNPFGPMPQLCAIADDVTKVHAICVRCGALAYVSHRIVAGDRQVMLGETHEYEPLCRQCYAEAIKP